MGININKISDVSASSFVDKSNKISIKEIEASMEQIDVNNPETVQKAVERCNNRCSDNDVDLELSILRPQTGGGHDMTEKISLSFHTCQ